MSKYYYQWSLCIWGYHKGVTPLRWHHLFQWQYSQHSLHTTVCVSILRLSQKWRLELSKIAHFPQSENLDFNLGFRQNEKLILCTVLSRQLGNFTKQSTNLMQAVMPPPPHRIYRFHCSQASQSLRTIFRILSYLPIRKKNKQHTNFWSQGNPFPETHKPPNLMFVSEPDY